VLKKTIGKKLGHCDDPLLVSVRYRATFSIPGMRETVLKIGLIDQSVRRLGAQSDNERFAFDSHRRLNDTSPARDAATGVSRR
jgi:pyruvate, orthophosphate dikinase